MIEHFGDLLEEFQEAVKMNNCDGDNNRDRPKTMVVNELLTYAFHHVDSCSPNALISMITEFYRPDEIIKAKACLWSTYEDDDMVLLQGTKPTRTNMKLEGPTLDKFVDELVNKGIVVAANTPGAVVPFCAVDLSRLPQCSPEQGSTVSILARLARLEQQMQKTIELTSQNSNDVKAVHINIPREKGASTLDAPRNCPPATSSKQMTPMPRDPDETTPMTYATSLKTSDNNVQQTIEASASTSRQELWQQQRRDRRRIIKESTRKLEFIKGSKNTGGDTKLRRAIDTKDVYIKDIDPDISDADISSYMKPNGITPRFVRQILGKRDGQKKSFKITLNVDDYQKAMTSDFWPVDIECRQWYTQEELRKINNESDD